MGSTINFGAALGSNQGVQWQVPRAFIYSFRLHHFPQRDASYLVAPLTSFFSKAPVNSGFATSWGIEPHGFVHRPVSSCNQHIAIFGEDAYDSNWWRPPFLPDAISLAYFIQWAYKLWFIWGGAPTWLLIGYLRPHEKILVLTDDQERYLLGREILILMGYPLHKVEIDQYSEQDPLVAIIK